MCDYTADRLLKEPHCGHESHVSGPETLRGGRWGRMTSQRMVSSSAVSMRPSNRIARMGNACPAQRVNCDTSSPAAMVAMGIGGAGRSRMGVEIVRICFAQVLASTAMSMWVVSPTTRQAWQARYLPGIGRVLIGYLSGTPVRPPRKSLCRNQLHRRGRGDSSVQWIRSLTALFAAGYETGVLEAGGNRISLPPVPQGPSIKRLSS
jgi:hypothetical protein